MRRVPLRVTLVAAMLLLVALALVLVGVTGTTALRTYLVERVDSQLADTGTDAAGRAERDTLRPGRGRGPGPRSLGPPPVATYVLQTDADGVGTGQLSVPPRSDLTAPQLPTLTADEVARRAGRPFTAPDTGSDEAWRVLVRELPGGGAVTVATGLTDVEGTVNRLRVVMLAVSAVALLLLGILGYVLVRSSLRRLVTVETTAATIAAGFAAGRGGLTRRVPTDGGRSEVDRLASAFNTMVDRIETAFAAQQASEVGARASEAGARASEERMRRFVADASHELRTPLTSIRGFAELYRQGAVTGPDGVGRAMSRIESEADRMRLLVEDLLLLARLDQQRPLDRHPVDLLALAADAVHDAGAQAPGRAVSLEVDTAAGPPVVLGDEARLRQVLANLVGNALTHTRSPVTIRVATSERGPVVLEVTDTGPGLEPEQAGKMFERFYRTDPARTRAAGGSGLGLSIVRALVAAHGGTVDVRTAPGEGATFRVELPPHDIVAN